MRAALLAVLLLSSTAYAQKIRLMGGGVSTGGGCSLDSTTTAIAPSYRATATTGTAYQVDSVLECGFDTGPGARNCIGTNVAGDILLGPGSGNTTIVRNFGDYIGLGITGSNVTASAAFILGTNAFLVNSSANPVRVTDTDGFQINGTSAIKGVVRVSVTFDFPSIPNGSCGVSSLTVTGAAVGDYVSVNADFALPTTVGIGNARVTATNTVDLRLCNHDAALAADPASGAYLIRLER